MMAPTTLQTLLFCTSFIDSEETWLRRYRPWLDFAESMPLDRVATFIIDDASTYCPDDPRLAIHSTLPHTLAPRKVHFYRFDRHLGRAGLAGYTGWWRSFLFSLDIAQRYGFRRLVHIESDAYLLSQRAVDYVNGLTGGWTALWCPRYNIPETGIQIIVHDQFAALRSIAAAGLEMCSATLAEISLPFTHVEKGLAGNRYGEYRTRIPKYADYACQVIPGMVPPRFEGTRG